jgi:uncharacterized protein (TIGR02266 family)
MSDEPPKKQRQHPRVPLHVEVTMESEHNFYTGITDNISEGGIFIACDPPPGSGTDVAFDLSLGGSEQKYPIEGVVCWVRSDRMSSEGMPAGCGIRWKTLPDEALLAIKRFIKGRETLFYED